jgi:general secretion pathway protein G
VAPGHLSPENRWSILRTLAGIAVGCTLVSTVAVLAVQVLNDDRPAQARAELQDLATLLEDFRRATGHYPSAEEGLHAVLYVGIWREQILDPWENEYVYRPLGTPDSESFELLSYGADGKPGGDGEDADIAFIPAIARAQPTTGLDVGKRSTAPGQPPR